MVTIRSALCGLVLAMLALVPAVAGAQGWRGQVTLYGWGVGMRGDFTPFAGAPTLSFDKSLSDILKDLDGAFFATALARHGDLVIFGDLTHSVSSRSGRVGPGIPASGRLKMQSLTLAAGRRFVPGGEGRTTIDLLGGLRAWRISGSVTSPVASIAPTRHVVDPIIAVRIGTQLSARWSTLGYLDVGGFGAGSDLTWQAAVTANYRLSGRAYLSFGWRHLELDRSRHGTRFDGTMSGPLAGLTMRF